MILTVTLNASLDMTYTMEKFVPNQVNRVSKVSKTAGGKGLNVTRVLHRLGVEVMATGLAGGNIGNYILEELTKDGVNHQFYRIKEESRNNISIITSLKQTELLEPGPKVTQAERKGFIDQYCELCDLVEVIVLSGSLPQQMPLDFYQSLIEIGRSKKKPVLLDTSGQVLSKTLNSATKPTLIKPNIQELSDITGKNISENDFASIKEVMESPIFDGIDWVVTTLGANGALIKVESNFYKADIPQLKIMNPIGSGDSAIAGLAQGFSENMTNEEKIRNGMLCGILNALEEKPGEIKLDNYTQIKEKIIITKY